MDYCVRESRLSDFWLLGTNRLDKCSPKALIIALERNNTELAQLLYDNHPRGYFKEPCCMFMYYNETQVTCIASSFEWIDREKRSEWVKDCIKNGITKTLFTKMKVQP